MVECSVKDGRIHIEAKAISIGEDLCVIISGGDTPHIGCVTASVPRPSLLDPNIISATTSVINFIGHKDDEVAKYVSHKLSLSLNKNVVATCGIHIERITMEEIKKVKALTEKLAQILLSKLS
ncbi:hypothetical protein [Alkalibaculum bacchi]|uniref:prenylated flavin chaperone LpdD n=1 Tax=Alkalibaculum bacchi TaxID=645887 RepID=UPI0026EC8088|nr:hypothetical protein [Alkalibaculum bacchi]